MAELQREQIHDVQQVDDDVMQFLMEVLQTFAENPDPKVVYPLLETNLDKVNLELAEALQVWADQMLPQFNPERRSWIAKLIGDFSNLLAIFPLNRAEAIEIAIVGYNIADQIFTREKYSEQWATNQYNLAGAYSDRIRGEQVQNIEDAIAVYKTILQIFTQEKYPEQWVATQNNLATAYTNRIKGERAQNLEDAIATYQLALQVRTQEQYPEKWAMTQQNLATAYTNRIRGERAQNLEDAIATYQLALQVRTQEQSPEQWAETQSGLASAYANRIRGKQSQNFEEAITAYQLALQVYTRELYPAQWAMLQNNLAIVLAQSLRGEQSQNLEDAISTCERALEVYTQENFPEQWAMTQNNLGNAYRDRIQGERSQNLEKAIAHYENALQIFTQEEFSTTWATIQNNLETTINAIDPENYDRTKIHQTRPTTQALFGSHFARVGHWKEGLSLLLESAQKLRESDDLLAYADVLHQTGCAYEISSDWLSARLYYRDALRLYEHLDHTPGIAKSRLSVGGVLISQGYIAKGMTELERARELYTELDQPQQIATIERLQQAAQQVGQQTQALSRVS